jgi:hypothetical protein
MLQVKMNMKIKMIMGMKMRMTMVAKMMMNMAYTTLVERRQKQQLHLIRQQIISRVSLEIMTNH